MFENLSPESSELSEQYFVSYLRIITDLGLSLKYICGYIYIQTRVHISMFTIYRFLFTQAADVATRCQLNTHHQQYL